MQGSIFWYITPCMPLNVNRRFSQLNADFVIGLFFDLEDMGDLFLRCRMLYSRGQKSS
jgi:hypothetical protein